MKKYGMEQITRKTEQPAASAVSASDIVKERLDKDASCEFKQGYVIIVIVEL